MYEYYAKLRNKFGMNDAKMAQMIGVSPSVFTRWKKGQSSPSSTTRKKICEALGIEPVMYFSDQQDYLPLKGNPKQNQSFTNTKHIDQDGFMPLDIEITVDGKRYMIDEQKLDELRRGIHAYISAWIEANVKL